MLLNFEGSQPCLANGVHLHANVFHFHEFSGKDQIKTFVEIIKKCLQLLTILFNYYFS